MTMNNRWTREQLLVAFRLYCQIPFGKLHSKNPLIINYANKIGRTPSALAMKLSNIASLDPEITSTGRRGLVGASVADRVMWDEVHSDWERFVAVSEEIMHSLKTNTSDEVIPEDDLNTDYGGVNRRVDSLARVGQRFFRQSVLSAYQGRCCITGLAIPQLLIASHIVPWKDDASNRLNPMNGLALSMLHDKAFDSGILTIREDFTLLVSNKYGGDLGTFFETSIRAYQGKKIMIPEKFKPQAEFLAYHRDCIFERV